MRPQNRFNPNLGSNTRTPEEPKYTASWWPLVFFVLALFVLSLLMPVPEARGLTHQVIGYQQTFHDATCDELHRQTHSLRQLMNRYEGSTDLPKKQQLWSQVTQVNNQRNEIIQQYRAALDRQAAGGNPQIYSTDQICRFSTISLQPVSLVARH